MTSNIKGRTCTAVFENMVLRKISGTNREEVTGDWRKLHKEGLHGLYPSQSITWVIK